MLKQTQIKQNVGLYKSLVSYLPLCPLSTLCVWDTGTHTHTHALAHTHFDHTLVKPQFASREATSMMANQLKATSWGAFLLSFFFFPLPNTIISLWHTNDRQPPQVLLQPRISTTIGCRQLSIRQVRLALVWGCGHSGFRLRGLFQAERRVKGLGFIWFWPLWPPTPTSLCASHTTKGEYHKIDTHTTLTISHEASFLC